MLTVNWTNPYAGTAGRWLRGNLHTHTHPASGCGTEAPERVLAQYEEAGYDFLALSDHLAMVEPPATRLALIPGIEWNSPVGEHAGVYAADPAFPRRAIGVSDQAELLAAHAETDGLLVMNHPNWILTPHYRREALLAKQHYDGIEIYNGVIERLQGYAISTDKWDYLLANGRRVLGFASDDSHAPCDIALGWLMVKSADETPVGILRALQAGRFYCSTGVTITTVGRDGSTVFVEAPDAQEIALIADGGVRLARAKGETMSASFDEFKVSYLRFELYGYGAAMAWTQPFFRE
ncbi:MAG: hypothetical protein BWY76_00645 [bacterium ADurb.Bin429]|nr:MAG: hypothetical protein BWY76_00645 [bacterium ADurb.Bin429]